MTATNQRGLTLAWKAIQRIRSKSINWCPFISSQTPTTTQSHWLTEERERAIPLTHPSGIRIATYKPINEQETRQWKKLTSISDVIASQWRILLFSPISKQCHNDYVFFSYGNDAVAVWDALRSISIHTTNFRWSIRFPKHLWRQFEWSDHNMSPRHTGLYSHQYFCRSIYDWITQDAY